MDDQTKIRELFIEELLEVQGGQCPDCVSIRDLFYTTMAQGEECGGC